MNTHKQMYMNTGQHKNKDRSCKFPGGTLYIGLVAVMLLTLACGGQQRNGPGDYQAYLFVYFTGNGPGEEAVHYAVSTDGFNFHALNHNRPVISPDSISRRGGVRDPHLLRGEDGLFYMVLTDLYVPEDGWSNQGMVLMKSRDLVHWTHSTVHIPDAFPEEFGKVNRVWAPQTIYDPEAGKYMIYFSMRSGEDPDIIYYAYANEDFTGLETVPEQLLYSPGACIDGDIVYQGGKYHLFFKTEGDGNGIKKAVSDSLTGGYVVQDAYLQQTPEAVEGSGIFKLNNSDRYILMYDVYMKGEYQFTESTDLETFRVIDDEVNMNFHPRHGSVLPLTRKEAGKLVAAYGDPEKDAITSAASPQVKTRNVVVDPAAGTVYLPVQNGEDLSSVDPGFRVLPGVEISPAGPQDFSAGPVDYTVKFPGAEGRVFRVEAVQDHNPVLDGYYADPEILYSRKTGKYYLYPTSDGFTGWSGTYFQAFSSDDLVSWTNEGVILDLEQDVSWADRNAWAPCIIEKETDGKYRYFYYFTAAQQIGVAVSEDPAGPFTDSGRPLIDQKPEGVRGGQEIDPDVFTDPETGQDYLYWGNGYLAVVPLNDDLVSFDMEKIRVMTPDTTFREGAEVFYRDGRYYFMWSENDTRSEDYRVRYAWAGSPTGPLTIPEDNLVIAKDPANGIYGTGHNSVLHIPETDEWYLIYHRFTRPHGIHMGRAAGYHREVCIDRLEFEADGRIRRVEPTLSGIQPRNTSPPAGLTRIQKREMNDN